MSASDLTPSAHVCCTRLVDLGVRFGDTTVLERVNLHLHCGELTAIVGPNGGGKTTLLRAVMGEIPHTGKMTFVPATPDGRSKRPRIGYVPQRMEIDRTTPVTVLDLFGMARSRLPIWLGHTRRTRDEAHAALDRVRGAELLDRPLGHLSCGQMQRVLLALALTPVPQLLLLDEPLAGMDRDGAALFYQVVNDLRRVLDLSILLVSHDLREVAAIADWMVFVQHTVLAEGRPGDVLRHPAVRETLGLDVPEETPVHERVACTCGGACRVEKT